MIEAHPNQRPGTALRFNNQVELLCVTAAGLFNQHVFAGGCGGRSDLSQFVMCGGDKDDVDVGTGHRLQPIPGSPHAAVS